MQSARQSAPRYPPAVVRAVVADELVEVPRPERRRGEHVEAARWCDQLAAAVTAADSEQRVRSVLEDGLALAGRLFAVPAYNSVGLAIFLSVPRKDA